MTILIPGPAGSRGGGGRGAVAGGTPLSSGGRTVRTPLWKPQNDIANPRIGDQADVIFAPVVRDERDVLEQGGRMASVYLSYDAATKASLTAGPGYNKAQAVVGGAGQYIVFDAAGVIPLDEFTFTIPVLSVGADLTAQSAGNIYIATVQSGGINQQSLYIARTGTTTLTVVLYIAGANVAQATLVLSVGDIPADTWTAVSVTYKAAQAKPLRIYVGSNVRASVAGGETTATAVLTQPFSGFVLAANGMALGSDFQSSVASVLKIGMPIVRREQMLPAAASTVTLPTITVDPSTTQGAMPDIAGVLHQYNGWAAHTYDTSGVLRDEIVASILAANGRRFRIEHILDKAIITGTGAAPVYDWGPLWALMDPIYDAGGIFDLTLGYTPSVLGATYGPPSNDAHFAAMCLAFVTAAVARYDVDAIASWSLWNEPDLPNFWAGGEAATTELVDLWAAVHDVLDPAFPSISVGATETTSWTLASAMAKAIIDRAATDGRRLDHVRYHDYGGDLRQVGVDAASMRAYCDAKTDTGDFVGANVVPAITEWNWSLQDSNQWEGGIGAFSPYRAVASRTEKIAAYIYAFLSECLENGVSFVSFTRSGIVFDGPIDAGETHLGMFGYESPAHPLPAFGGHEVWWKTRGLTRISATANGWPSLRTVAALDEETGRIVITGGTWKPGLRDGRHPVYIAVDDLPASYSWTYSQLDRSNYDDGRLPVVESGNTALGEAMPLGRSLSNMGVFALEITPN